jgi:hypothetical protein
MHDSRSKIPVKISSGSVARRDLIPALKGESHTALCTTYGGKVRLFLGAFAKLRKPTSIVTSVSPSIRPHETTQPPLNGFSSNLVYENFWKTCPEN